MAFNKRKHLLNNIIAIQTAFEVEKEGKPATSRQEETRTMIMVSYTDGVSKQRMRGLTRQFTHCYPAGREMIRVYINLERNMSPDTQKKLFNEIKSVWKIKDKVELDDFFLPINGTVRDYIDKIFEMRDF